jgi:hypothetical protein
VSRQFLEPRLGLAIGDVADDELIVGSFSDTKPWLYIRKPYQFADLMDLLGKAGLGRQKIS